MGIISQDADSPQRPITPGPHQGKHPFRLGMLQKKLHNFLFSRDDPLQTPVQNPQDISWPDQPPPQSQRDWSARPVGVGLPRQATFKRQNSEKRERLCPVEPTAGERRAVSHSRPVSVSLPRRRASSTPIPYNPTRTSAPAIAGIVHTNDSDRPQPVFLAPLRHEPETLITDNGIQENYRPPRPASITSSRESDDERFGIVDDKALINEELDTRWILNLSMHFRDKSDREKFFVTYAETPTKWRRVTVSCDYRNAEPGSLEMDLKELQFQRDKSMQIYESIRDSLREIQFYDTVTNLKLETADGRLHVHVTEDVNEIIPYPPRGTIAHLFEDHGYRPREIRESDLKFDSHLSGFVYKVGFEGQTFIKKEIPGPDTVDEFLYEINALHALHESTRVIRLEAIVVDDARQIVKGLLITYAEKGAIVDLLYDHRGKIPLLERLAWARDVVVGLSDIHEEGYVQGDFTLSNIVIDGNGDAKIIDINRRGCPVGWEPPEIRAKIASHQRISMYIGEKSDLYQLGMTLWGLAADDDEPERHEPPLLVDELPEEVPFWYKNIVRICLSERPRDRRSAKELTDMFPDEVSLLTSPPSESRPELNVRIQKRYIDPSQAVEREDIDRFRRSCHDDDMPYSPQSSRDDPTYTFPKSSENDRASDRSAYERPRGRRPPTNLEHLNHHERRAWSPDERPSPLDEDAEANVLEIVPGQRAEYDTIDFEGKPFLIARNTFSDAELKILEYDMTLEDSTPTDQRHDADKPVAEPDQVHEMAHIPSQRPMFPSRVSATSSSTPRNSSVVLPQLSEQQLAELNGSLSDNLYGRTNDSREQATDSLSSTEALSSEHVRPDSNSPQPPPSLHYADSGFHEPSSFDEAEVEALGREGLFTANIPAEEAPRDDSSHIEQSHVVSSGETPENKVRKASTAPPPLLRSGTSIRIGVPIESASLSSSSEPKMKSLNASNKPAEDLGLKTLAADTSGLRNVVQNEEEADS